MATPFLLLPAEVRLRVYDFLPELASGRHEIVTLDTVLTPAICRVNKLLRRETLPLYAGNCHFAIQIDGAQVRDGNVISAWLEQLEPSGLKSVTSVQLSCHWRVPQPTRWQGHVGFYVRLEVLDDRWQCTTGTYPIVNDMRGMRSESVELLKHILDQHVGEVNVREDRVLLPADVEAVARAMEIVASHPISAFDTEQSETGRKRRREIWLGMEQDLLGLNTGRAAQSGSHFDRFFTPY